LSKTLSRIGISAAIAVAFILPANAALAAEQWVLYNSYSSYDACEDVWLDKLLSGSSREWTCSSLNNGRWGLYYHR
jgi:hypothetical protein